MQQGLKTRSRDPWVLHMRLANPLCPSFLGLTWLILGSFLMPNNDAAQDNGVIKVMLLCQIKWVRKHIHCRNLTSRQERPRECLREEKRKWCLSERESSQSESVVEIWKAVRGVKPELIGQGTVLLKSCSKKAERDSRNQWESLGQSWAPWDVGVTPLSERLGLGSWGEGGADGVTLSHTYTHTHTHPNAQSLHTIYNWGIKKLLKKYLIAAVC